MKVVLTLAILGALVCSCSNGSSGGNNTISGLSCQQLSDQYKAGLQGFPGAMSPDEASSYMAEQNCPLYP